MRGLYVHIPFCKSKCGYCDFNSFAGCEGYMEEYVTAVIREMESQKGKKADTIYIGGGTPTHLPLCQIVRLIEGVNNNFDISKSAEFTVEMNPCTADFEYLKKLKKLGVNRISMGAQSFDDGLLKILGRLHNAADISSSINLCRKAGIENVSLDLMFSLPGQTEKMWRDTLEKAILCKPDHISCYGLKIEEGTPFYDMGYEPLDEETDRSMYHYTIEYLRGEGYIQYEISNFALPGRESRHNLKYWNCEEYFGLGAGAHGFLSGVRRYNVSHIEEYIKRISQCGSAVQEETVLTPEDILTEKIIMGLRRTCGIDKKLVKCADEYIKHGFMEEIGNNVRFTTKGFDVSNEILSKII